MARKYLSRVRSGHIVLVVDDSPEVLESTRQLLEGEGHRVLTAPDGPSGIAVAEKERPHLILVDYFMPGMTGEEVVRQVRARDRLVQIILATGYAGEKPARLMMQQLDIQGYHDKGEGAERLLLWTDSALKAYRAGVAAEKHRIGLQYILDITPDLHRLQPLDDLLQGLLWQIEGLVGAENSFLATVSSEEMSSTKEQGADQLEGFVAIVDESSASEGLEIRVATGRFRRGIAAKSLPEPERSLVEEATQTGRVSFSGDVSVLPLRLGERVLGTIFIDRRPGYQRDRDLLEIFASQAAAAIRSALLYGRNTQLYDLATKDPTTDVYLRGYLLQELEQSLKRSHRTGLPVSALMVDLDKFKAVNDNHGHLVGDATLAATGRLLRGALRDTDYVGRYGGDEFIVVLPDTPAEGARSVVERIMERSREVRIETDTGTLPLRLSIGAATLLRCEEARPMDVLRPSALGRVAEHLIGAADAALYAAKSSGQPVDVADVNWPSDALAGAA